MNNDYHNDYRFNGLIFISFMILFFSSCDTYNFSQPQPADKENIYEFPKDFQGYWILDKEDESVNIGIRNVEFIEDHYTEKIVKGAWPRLDDKGNFINSPFDNGGLKTIRYNSLKRPIDTINNYLVRGNYIYHTDSKGLLEKGYHYRVDNDTIIVSIDDTTLLDLGRNAFLRKLNNKYYVLNINNSIIGDLNNGDINRWWQVLILDKKDKAHINVWYLTEKFEQLPSMFYNHDGFYYFDGKWTTADMMRLLHEGNFKVGSRLIRDKKTGKKN